MSPKKAHEHCRFSARVFIMYVHEPSKRTRPEALFLSACAVPALNMGTVLFTMGGYGTFLGWYMRMNPKEKMALAPGPALGKSAVRHLDPSPAARVQISNCDPSRFALVRWSPTLETRGGARAAIFLQVNFFKTLNLNPVHASLVPCMAVRNALHPHDGDGRHLLPRRQRWHRPVIGSGQAHHGVCAFHDCDDRLCHARCPGLYHQAVLWRGDSPFSYSPFSHTAPTRHAQRARNPHATAHTHTHTYTHTHTQNAQSARTAHAFFGTATMGLFLFHASQVRKEEGLMV